MKKIMLISAQYTGHGHTSIANSLLSWFQEIPDVEVKVVDGFSLMGNTGLKSSKLYGPITRYAPRLWKASWDLTDRFPITMSAGIELAAHQRFYKLIDEYQPNLILTVHSMFNSVISHMLKMRGLDIPLVTLQADIINIHSSWCDPHAYRTICPTQEAYTASLRQGMPEDKLVKLGFPTRRQFTDAAQIAPDNNYEGTRPLRCLMMSGGEGMSGMKNYVETMLRDTNAEVTVICGRNAKLKQTLEAMFLPEFEDRLHVYGFVTEVEKEMINCDLVIGRGSPNFLMEAIVMNRPIIVIGCLPGQESDNPRLIQDHHLGVICKNTKALPGILKQMTANSCRWYKEILKAQKDYCNYDNAKNIANYVADLAMQF